MGDKKTMIKNRAPAPIQITAEQILREAHDRQQAPLKPTNRRIADSEELDEYRMTKRREFEDEIRRQQHHIGTWMKYAKWEESQHEFKRARSVYERALDVDYKSVTIWLKYAEMEQQHKFINHARNIWDRAVTLLPRVDQLWYKYAYMEEMVGSLNNARQVFERWMQWQPDDKAWFSYIQLEMRAKEIPRARALYNRYVECHPTERAYIKFSRWEEKLGHLPHSRDVLERAMDELMEEQKSEKLFIAFAQFEERCGEYERSRAIYQLALNRFKNSENEEHGVPTAGIQELTKAFTKFERQYGDRSKIEEVVLTRRRAVYEEDLAENPRNYEKWLDYIRLEQMEGSGSPAVIEELFERAIAQVPLVEEKSYWSRYIYLWVEYFLYEELVCDNTDKTREVFETCLKLIPHKKFTFGKIWIYYAMFEIRQRDVTKARKILGISLGKCPKASVFRKYIELERQLGDVDRIRMLYQKFLEFSPYLTTTWKEFSELEKQLDDIERSRGILELAVEQEELDKPEFIWKYFIEFEIELKEITRAKDLYERLLEKTKHPKVWSSYAAFYEEYRADLGGSGGTGIFERSYAFFKEEGRNAERAVMLETWLDFEKRKPEDRKDSTLVTKLQGMLPRKVTKKRMSYGEDGEELGMEEYEDFLFPEDESSKANLKLFQAAHLWKQKMQNAS